MSAPAFCALDPCFARIVPSGAAIERVATGFQFTEGPVWSFEGALLFSDIPANTVYRWEEARGAQPFLKPSGYDGEGPAPGELMGSNGLTLDATGRLVLCEHGNRRLTRLERDGTRTVLASQYQGKRLNSPNDVVGRSDGSWYFTDPPYGLAGKEEDPRKELAFAGVYRASAEGLQLLFTGFRRPNGLAFSPDERYLYVGNSEPDRRQWLRFEVMQDGTLGEGVLFQDLTEIKEPGNPDGMKVDVEGNLYCTGPGGVWVLGASGLRLGVIRTPEIPANCHWGDADARTLYITARTSVYRVRLKIPGVRPAPVA